MIDPGLTDKVVLITGAASGIGLATARAFAQQGARVVAADLDPSGITSEPSRHAIEAAAVDVTEEGALARFVDDAAGRLGGLDVLVNNVGVAPYRTGFLGVGDSDWWSLLNVNVFSMIRASRAAIPHMIRRGGGSIVNLASDAGSQPDPFFVDYALSKSAVLSLSKSLSKEFGPYGIRSNCVAPGPTATPGMDGFLMDLAQELEMTPDEAKVHFARDMRHLPLERMNEPEDVAAVILFLASDAARQVTGSSYRVDAGSHVFI